MPRKKVSSIVFLLIGLVFSGCALNPSSSLYADSFCGQEDSETWVKVRYYDGEETRTCYGTVECEELLELHEENGPEFLLLSNVVVYDSSDKEYKAQSEASKFTDKRLMNLGSIVRMDILMDGFSIN